MPLIDPPSAPDAASFDAVLRELRRDDRRAAPGRHRGAPRRRRRWVAGALLVVAVPTWLVVRSWADPPPGQAPADRPAAASWEQVLGGLDRARLDAWSSGDAAALARVDGRGSSALAADLAVLRALRRDGVRPEGLTTTVSAVLVRGSSPGRVRLTVVDRRSAYRLVRPGGRVVRAVPGRGPVAWDVVLAREDDAWRVVTAMRGTPLRTSGART